MSTDRPKVATIRQAQNRLGFAIERTDPSPGGRRYRDLLVAKLVLDWVLGVDGPDLPEWLIELVDEDMTRLVDSNSNH